MARLDLTVVDLRRLALEMFSAGAVQHERVLRRLTDLLGEAPDKNLARLGTSAQRPPDGRAGPP